MFVHNRAHIFEKATESTHNDTVFSVLMAVPCTMVCYLVGMLFTHVHVHNKKGKKKEIVCITFIYSHDVRTDYPGSCGDLNPACRGSLDFVCYHVT